MTQPNSLQTSPQASTGPLAHLPGDIHMWVMVLGDLVIRAPSSAVRSSPHFPAISSDAFVQSYESPTFSSNLGAAASIYPYGFSIGYWTPHIEGPRLQPGDHDLAAAPFAEIAGRYLVVEEKLDGPGGGHRAER